MKFKNFRILLLVLSFSVISKTIELPSESKINEYKQQIERQIRFEKLKRYLAAGVGSVLIYKAIFGSKKPEVIQLSAKEFSEDKLNILNDLIESFKNKRLLIVPVVENQSWLDFINAKASQLFKGIVNTTELLLKSTPYVLGQVYMVPGIQWLAQHFNGKWVLYNSGIVLIAEELKFSAANLDPQSPVLETLKSSINIVDSKPKNNDNNDANPYPKKKTIKIKPRIDFTTLDELLKLNATTRVRTNWTKEEFETQAKIVRDLSNKLIDGSCKVIAYLRYKEQNLILEQTDLSYQQSREFSDLATQLLQYMQSYVNEMNLALKFENYQSKAPNDKNILALVYNYLLKLSIIIDRV